MHIPFISIIHTWGQVEGIGGEVTVYAHRDTVDLGVRNTVHWWFTALTSNSGVLTLGTREILMVGILHYEIVKRDSDSPIVWQGDGHEVRVYKVKDARWRKPTSNETLVFHDCEQERYSTGIIWLWRGMRRRNCGVYVCVSVNLLQT